MNAWDCKACGAPENYKDKCWLCDRTEEPAESEEDEVVRMLRAAELEFSEALGEPISLAVVGGVGPSTIEEARVLIAEMREHVEAQLAEDEDPSAFGFVIAPEPDRWGS